MKRTIWIAAGALIAASFIAGAWNTPASRLHTFHHENVLGTSLDLKVAAVSAEAATRAETAVLAEIDREAKILSSYDASSEFSRWSRTTGQPVRISPELFEVLSLFDNWRGKTAGALDPAAEVVTRVWKHAAAAGRRPSATELDAAIASVRRPHWTLDASARTATHLDNAPLALNSFAKSYIAGRAASAGLSAASAIVVNIGGDIVIRGPLTELVRIANPMSDAENAVPVAELRLRNRTIATSGNYRRGFDIGGRHYSHIVDPRTASPAGYVISSTVVSPDPAEAGALATAFSVMSPAESRKLAESLPGVDYLLLTKDGRRFASRGWKALEAAPVDAPVRFLNAAQNAPAQGAWQPAYELAISLELAKIEGQRYRRPYLAAWIEDKDKFPLRTFALWYNNKDRWLPELHSWFRDDRMRSLAEGAELATSISSATRPAGKYSIKWDGKDNKGKYVKPGHYIVCVEVSREHGEYQIYRQEMDFSGTPKHIQLAGGAEITALSLDYRKLTTN